ncbi:MAG: hypothetical protein V5A57_02820 [Candidatus Paceibacterota bacterium]
MVPQEVANILNQAGVFIKHWWWVPLPFLLYKPFLNLWLFWRRSEYRKEQNFIMLEIRVPKDAERPLRAMDNILSGLWSLYEAPNWKEKWLEGVFILPLSFEIAGLGGEPHFFIRTPDFYRNTVESHIYSQFPEAEIEKVPDYTDFVPDDIPNEEWDMWGCDFELMKDTPYPIKTYTKFFEERPGAEKEEKVDPMALILEGMGKMTKNEQLWIQIVATPVTDGETGWISEGEELRDELAGRSTSEGGGGISIVKEAINVLLTGTPPNVEVESEEPRQISPEMELTSGEKKKISAIEDKIGQYGYKSFIRTIYLAKKDDFFKPHVTIPIAFFNQFATSDLNSFKPWGKTITKVNYLFTERRGYLKKRKMFERYKNRLSPLYPQEGGTYTLNTEELATIFHFPGEEAAPAPFIERIEARKGEPPRGLPTE